MARWTALALLAVFLLPAFAGAVPVLEHVYARDSFVVEGVRVSAEFYDYRSEFEGKIPTFEFCANAGGDQAKIAELLARGECRTRVSGSAYQQFLDGSCFVVVDGQARPMRRRGWTVFYIDLHADPGEHVGLVRCRAGRVGLEAPVRFEKTRGLRVVDLVGQARIVEGRKTGELASDSAVGAVFAVGARSFGGDVQTTSFPLCWRV